MKGVKIRASTRGQFSDDAYMVPSAHKAPTSRTYSMRDLCYEVGTSS
jgi:hypothetical protein